MTKSFLALLAGVVVVASQAYSAEPTVAALHLKNNAGPSLESYLGAFEDSISSRFSSAGLRIVSARGALEAFSGDNDAAADSVTDGSSLQRVAQNLGADFALSATITSYNKNTKSFDSYGVKGTNEIHTLRVSYQLLDVADGASVLADTVSAQATIRQTGNLNDDGGSMLPNLLDEAASKLATAFAIKTKSTDIGAIAAKKSEKEVTFTLAITSQTIAIPSVTAREDGTFDVKPSTYSVEPADFTVELDGLTIGSAGSATEFTALPGLHRLKISREGYKDWSRMVNIREGMTLKIEAAQTAAELAKMKELVSYFQGLSKQTTLSAAEAEVLQGRAQALRQSGYRIDTQIKSDSVEETDLHIGDTPQTLDLLRDVFSN
ncbi:PEGA domain-containing protein [Pelagicoccus enzymogenes]|uniref:PEGA domain-containing protein n=1 Tax=Pelagicoccus enzymogenes TaxID=2773457 RepID=UPI00280E936E|nr:PEGA domain-containing protein [Pelagicoccus enzymogenes]MDQ8196748.1 PEGA domain-containing protein [Pelagicoccus enzymogenes]